MPPSENETATDEEIEIILQNILESGSPIVLLCLPFAIAESIVLMGAEVDAFDTSSIMWVFSDFFMTADLQLHVQSQSYVNLTAGNILNGAFFIYPHQAENDLSASYLSLWEDLDPELYRDGNKDRSDIQFFSSYIVDSLVALSLAYQNTLEESNYEDGSIFRERVFFNLVNYVNFDGMSGVKSFNSFGDLNHPIFDVFYVGATGEDMHHIGSINDTAVDIDMTSFYWPDGTQGKERYGNSSSL